MVEISDDKANLIVGLLAHLVVASTKDDPVLALVRAGLSQAEVAKVLGMNLSTVSMRVSRAGKKESGNAKRKTAD